MASDPPDGEPLHGVRLLTEHQVRRGERWIYSAGFNTDQALTSTARIDSELDDITALSRAGARVAVLSHQGSHRDGSAGDLAHIAAYLSRRTGREVGYHPHSADEEAPRIARAMAPGSVVLFGNTRAYSGEERGDPELARAFAPLGDLVAMGGFSKAHRAHASNTGLLELLPGYATRGLVREVDALRPWARGPARGAVAVLGGRKPEKVLAGLSGLIHRHEVLVPGGVVLNTLLSVLGHRIGASWLGTSPRRCAAVARAVVAGPHRARLHLPSTVYAAKVDARGEPRGPAEAVRLGPGGPGVPDDRAIVDFDLPDRAREGLERAERILVAGTPCAYRSGHTRAVDAILPSLPGARSLLLGGDTVAELPWRGEASTGGGSALTLLADGDCAVLRALRSNASHPLVKDFP